MIPKAIHNFVLYVCMKDDETKCKYWVMGMGYWVIIMCVEFYVSFFLGGW